MLLEYYSIRIADAVPGKGLLHSTAHFDEVRSSIKHFKEKHPDKKIVAFKHTLKKGPMGIGHKRKKMWEETEMTNELIEEKKYKVTYDIHGSNRDIPLYTSHKMVRGKDENEAIGVIKKLVGGRNHKAELVSEETIIEATRSMRTLLRAIDDKKGIKNLKVPTPAERRELFPGTLDALNKLGKPEKKDPVKESTDLSEEVVHSVKHNDDVYTVHKEGSLRGNAYHIKKNETRLAGKHASINNAKGWLTSHINHLTNPPGVNRVDKQGKAIKEEHSHVLSKDAAMPGYTPGNKRLIVKNGTVLQHKAGNSYEIRAGLHKGKQINLPTDAVVKKYSESKEESTMKTYKELTENTFKVSHGGHPNADTDSSMSHLKTGKTYINHVTKYENSATKTAKMLKDKGFIDVQVHKNGKLVESVELDESKMSDLHLSIGQHLDKHIANYKRVGGADHLMGQADKAAKKISASHNLKPEHATKFVNDYLGSKLDEETELDESVMKRIKRAIQGWDKSHTGTPKELVKRNRAYDDETIKSLAKGRDISKPTHSPRGLQDKVLGQELKRRGMEEDAFAKGIVDPRTYVPGKNKPTSEETDK